MERLGRRREDVREGVSFDGGLDVSELEPSQEPAHGCRREPERERHEVPRHARASSQERSLEEGQQCRGAGRLETGPEAQLPREARAREGPARGAAEVEGEPGEPARDASRGERARDDPEERPCRAPAPVTRRRVAFGVSRPEDDDDAEHDAVSEEGRQALERCRPPVALFVRLDAARAKVVDPERPEGDLDRGSEEEPERRASRERPEHALAAPPLRLLPGDGFPTVARRRGRRDEGRRRRRGGGASRGLDPRVARELSRPVHGHGS